MDGRLVMEIPSSQWLNRLHNGIFKSLSSKFMKIRSHNFWVYLLVLSGLAVGQVSWGQSEESARPPNAGGDNPQGLPHSDRERSPGMPHPEGESKGERGDWRSKPPMPGQGLNGERFGGDRDRRGSGGGKSLGGHPPMWGAGFERLSEDQKRRVRDALSKAWGKPEVIGARDRLIEANDMMRRAIHEALMEIDPEIAKILASMKESEGMGGRGEPPRLPPVESPDFPVAALKRLEMELLVFSPPERKEQTRQLLAKMMEMPAVQESVARLKQAPVKDRMRVMEELRRLYREVVGEELKAFRARQNELSVRRQPADIPARTEPAAVNPESPDSPTAR